MEDILLNAGVVAGGSMKGVMSGHNYNRAVRSHSLLCEALERLRWEFFLQTLSEADQMKLRYFYISSSNYFLNPRSGQSRIPLIA